MKIILGNNLSKSFRDYFNELVKNRPDLCIMPASIDVFRSGEPYAELQEDPAGHDVTVFQSTSGNVSLACMQLLIIVTNLKKRGARSVTVAMPFAAFGRQDKETLGCFPSIACRDFPIMLKAMGADKIITADVHSKAGENFYSDLFGQENVTFISNADLFAQDILATHAGGLDNIVIGAPDGADKPEDAAQVRARDITRIVHNLAPFETLNGRIFGIKKVHRSAHVTEIKEFTGDVANRHAIVIDDMSDSGGTGLNACETLLRKGATATTFYLSHGLFDEEALDKIFGAHFRGLPVIGRIIVTDSAPGIDQKCEALQAKHPDATSRIRILSTAPQFASALPRPAI